MIFFRRCYFLHIRKILIITYYEGQRLLLSVGETDILRLIIVFKSDFVVEVMIESVFHDTRFWIFLLRRNSDSNVISWPPIHLLRKQPVRPLYRFFWRNKPVLFLLSSFFDFGNLTLNMFIDDFLRTPCHHFSFVFDMLPISDVHDEDLMELLHHFLSFSQTIVIYKHNRTVFSSNSSEILFQIGPINVSCF